ncbi:signal transduction histidine kinase [Roseimicrobium gellanilyticum]|uniref:Oxygen sensor histidine kinase NreB n=1 Tax=Roseimicrobium gellanilyticum TaxID=748857 RepID=A0A366HPW3_9BACT|nr:ATP-binding protein [Roseimicrobium gellanilyticum]RBP45154.1 signal transduction histidine kinase [Roseimicrobium gellanilyticum]
MDTVHRLCTFICLLALVPLRAQAEGDLLSRAAHVLDGELQRTDARIGQIHQILGTLARVPAEQTGERLGYHSRILQGTPEQLWVQIDLSASETLDTVVIVPVVLPKEQGGIEGYGFPWRFKVEVSDDAGFATASTIDDHTKADFPNPGKVPVILRVGETKGRYLRLTSTLPAGRRNKNGQVSWPSLALAEIMVLRNDRNLAAGRPVTAPTSREAPPVWSLANLTDSESILGPPVGAVPTERKGWHSIAYPEANTPLEITLDLGEAYPIEDVRLFPMRWTGYPHWVGFGFPVRFKVESALEPSFSLPHLVADFTATDFPNPGMNPTVMPANGIIGRYVRITTTKQWERFTDHAVALSEVQVYSAGRNAAKGRTPRTTSVYPDKPWADANLVDGDASENPILAFPAWIAQLERSISLERELTELEEERTARMQQWREWAMSAGITLGTLVLVLPTVFLIRNSLRRRRDLRQLRERIARDLHDEVGSNLAGIALLSREAEKADAAGRASLLEEIQRVAQETAGSMHDLVWMIQPGAPGDLVNGLRALAERMLKGMEQVAFNAMEDARRITMSLDMRRELYLMCKEVLQNIVKHSQATAAGMLVEVKGGALKVTIDDNGRGFDTAASSNSGFGLNNLRERARRIGGSCAFESDTGKGTTVTITVPLQ